MTQPMHAEIASRTLGLAQRVAASNLTKPDFGIGEVLSEVGLTSVDLVSLMLAVEAEFDIMIPAPYLNAENFKSIDTIASMVEKVRAEVSQ